MITRNFLRGRRRDAMSDDDLAAVDALIAEVREVPARKVVLKSGEALDHSTYLIDGMMCRYMDDRDGRRQLVAMQITGDFVDLHAFPLRWLDHDVGTITPCRVGIVPHERLAQLQRERPQLMRMLWFSTLLDAAMHREWIFRLGRLNAIGRLAHFLAELEYRLRMVGESDGRRFLLPMLQADLAEACGMTPVHLNRVVRRLRDLDLVALRDGQAFITDLKGLWQLAEFDPRYLFPDGGVAAPSA